jgi:hypothetical protein
LVDLYYVCLSSGFVNNVQVLLPYLYIEDIQLSLLKCFDHLFTEEHSVNNNNTGTNEAHSQQIKRRKTEDTVLPIQLDPNALSNSLLESFYSILKELEFVYNPLDTLQLYRCVVTLQTIMKVFIKYDPSKIFIVIAKLIICAKSSFSNQIDEKVNCY